MTKTDELFVVCVSLAFLALLGLIVLLAPPTEDDEEA